jgi:hypothetical protein
MVLAGKEAHLGVVVAMDDVKRYSRQRQTGSAGQGGRLGDSSSDVLQEV